jgi:hypothetical protein
MKKLYFMLAQTWIGLTLSYGADYIPICLYTEDKIRKVVEAVISAESIIPFDTDNPLSPVSWEETKVVIDDYILASIMDEAIHITHGTKKTRCQEPQLPFLQPSTSLSIKAQPMPDDGLNELDCTLEDHSLMRPGSKGNTPIRGLAANRVKCIRINSYYVDFIIIIVSLKSRCFVKISEK